MDDTSTTRVYTNFVANPDTGEMMPDVHQIIEVATGLNYFDMDRGQWRVSQDLIELTPDGGAAAVHGPMKAFFKPNLASGITLVTKNDRVFFTRPVGIYYFNPDNGESVELAPLNEKAIGELHPPNQIIWKSAFDSASVQADLRVTYTRYGFECDVIYTRKPKSPEAWAPLLDPNTAQLQVRHIWLNCPDPVKTDHRPLNDQQVDEIADFGDLWFPTGKAFLDDGMPKTDGENAAQIDLPREEDNENSLMVAKQWKKFGKKDVILTESVKWKNIQTHLSRLPEMAAVKSKDSSTATAKNDAQGSNPTEITDRSKVIQMAGAPYRDTGFVVDYITVSSGGNFTFVRDTHYISGACFFNGTVTFNPGAILKYDNGAFLLVSGTIVCNCNNTDPAIITSANEDIFGQRIDTSTGNPWYSASDALWTYFSNGSGTLSGFRIRWAQRGVTVSGYQTLTLANSRLEWCQTGINLNWGASLYLQNTIKCSLTSDFAGGTVYGQFADDWCVGDGDGDYLLDSWEYRHFGKTENITGSDDSDGDCSSNQAEQSADTSPLLPYPAWISMPEYQVVHAGANVTFSASATPGCLIYEWRKGSMTGPTISTSSSLTINNAQASDSALYTLIVRQPSPLIPTNSLSRGFRLVVLNDWGWNNWTSYISTTNNKTTNIWAQPPSSNPVQLNWDHNSILYGKTGFTAISQVNDISPPDTLNGQIPITALTRRHGYTRGHDMGFSTNTHGWNNNLIGKKVWFCTADDQEVEMTVAKAYTRYIFDNYGKIIYDYTIVIFTEDLPTSITPMIVTQKPSAEYFGTYFTTCQHGIVNANQPPFNYNEVSKPSFNDHDMEEGGDSGSPDMLLTSSGTLVFVGGRTTTGPSAQMQDDMDALSSFLGLTIYYQMNWCSVIP